MASSRCKARRAPRALSNRSTFLSAETEGMLGYLIEQELRNALPPGKELASILSQVVVDPNDPAFHNPTKPIGPIYSEDEAQPSVVRAGLVDRAGRRRLAPVRSLSAAARNSRARRDRSPRFARCRRHLRRRWRHSGLLAPHDGRLYGIEAVIDKDHASALLAREVKADCLLLLTDVDSVYLGWRTAQSADPLPSPVPTISIRQQFEPGSMRPKVEAAIEFVRRTGRRAAIGRLEDAAALLEGTAGTLIEMSQAGLRLRDRS